MVRLWGEFHDLYGTKAEMKLGLVGELEFDKWKRKLSVLPHEKLDAAIDVALSKCLMLPDKWPPELQEFLRFCLEALADMTPKAAHREFKRLPAPKIDYSREGAGYKAIQELKKIVGNPS